MVCKLEMITCGFLSGMFASECKSCLCDAEDEMLDFIDEEEELDDDEEDLSPRIQIDSPISWKGPERVISLEWTGFQKDEYVFHVHFSMEEKGRRSTSFVADD
jgi:hypothetical protein